MQMLSQPRMTFYSQIPSYFLKSSKDGFTASTAKFSIIRSNRQQRPHQRLSLTVLNCCSLEEKRLPSLLPQAFHQWQDLLLNQHLARLLNFKYVQVVWQPLPLIHQLQLLPPLRTTLKSPEQSAIRSQNLQPLMRRKQKHLPVSCKFMISLHLYLQKALALSLLTMTFLPAGGLSGKVPCTLMKATRKKILNSIKGGPDHL